MKIIKPTLILDEDRCRKNIRNMSLRASGSDVDFRPHFKTHQSLEIGTWFREFGTNKITVSSLEMAVYFSQDWRNITVAFPVNILEIETINTLAEKITLNLLIESEETAAFLADNMKQRVGFYIKIDVGYHRTGVDPTETKLIDKILTRASAFLEFKGFLTHAGHTYDARSTEEILAIHDQSRRLLIPLKERYKREYPNLIISIGDTPSCSVADDFSFADEIRPGNFVFYDLSQVQIGACNADQVAVALACPIVAVHEQRSEVVIYGGGVHFSKERLNDQQAGRLFGRVVEQNGDSWGAVIPDMFVRSLSQEHGTISVPASKIKDLRIGDILYILPVHSCMTANLMKAYRTTDGRTIARL